MEDYFKPITEAERKMCSSRYRKTESESGEYLITFNGERIPEARSAIKGRKQAYALKNKLNRLPQYGGRLKVEGV